MSFPSSSDVSFHVGQRIPLTLDNRISTSRILAGRHSLAFTPALVPTLLRTGRGDRFCSRAKTQKTRQYFTSNLFLWQVFGSHAIGTKCLKHNVNSYSSSFHSSLAGTIFFFIRGDHETTPGLSTGLK